MEQQSLIPYSETRSECTACDEDVAVFTCPRCRFKICLACAVGFVEEGEFGGCDECETTYRSVVHRDDGQGFRMGSCTPP